MPNIENTICTISYRNKMSSSHCTGILLVPGKWDQIGFGKCYIKSFLSVKSNSAIIVTSQVLKKYINNKIPPQTNAIMDLC